MSETAAKKNIQKLQRAIVDGLEDVKAQDIQVFNTEALSPLFERVIVASGTSNRQTKALAASVRDAVREAGFDKPRTEGEENGEWIIVDCGAAVVHVMQPSIRQYYRLEELWGDKPVRIKHAAQAKIAQPSDNAAAPARKAAKPRKAATAGAEVAAVSAKRVRKSLAASAAAAAPAPAPAKKTPARKTAAGAAAPAKSSAKRSAQPTRSAPIKVVKVGLDAAKSASKKATPAKAVARKAPAKVAKVAKSKA
jgi:ribosome-associated protein